MRMKPAILSIALLLGVWSPAPAEDAEVPHVTASARDGLVTLSAQGAPLREILAEFGRASRIEIYLESSVSVDEATTVAFESTPPEEGLRRLLRARNFIFVYSGGSLAQVRVYTEGQGEFRRLATETQGRTTAMRNPPGPAEAPSTSSPGTPGKAQTADPAPDKEAIRFRSEALGNPDPEKRVAGLEELAAGDFPQLALDTAVTVLGSERVADVLQTALTVLAGLDKVPVEPILTFLSDNRVQDASLRVRALEILGEHGQGDPRVRDLVNRIARSDKDEEVRESAKSLLEDLSQ